MGTPGPGSTKPTRSQILHRLLRTAPAPGEPPLGETEARAPSPLQKAALAAETVHAFIAVAGGFLPTPLPLSLPLPRGRRPDTPCGTERGDAVTSHRAPPRPNPSPPTPCHLQLGEGKGGFGGETWPFPSPTSMGQRPSCPPGMRAQAAPSPSLCSPVRTSLLAGRVCAPSGLPVQRAGIHWDLPQQTCPMPGLVWDPSAVEQGAGGLLPPSHVPSPCPLRAVSPPAPPGAVSRTAKEKPSVGWGHPAGSPRSGQFWGALTPPGLGPACSPWGVGAGWVLQHPVCWSTGRWHHTSAHHGGLGGGGGHGQGCCRGHVSQGWDRGGPGGPRAPPPRLVQTFQRFPHSLHSTNVVMGSSALRICTWGGSGRPAQGMLMVSPPPQTTSWGPLGAREGGLTWL